MSAPAELVAVATLAVATADEPDEPTTPSDARKQAPETSQLTRSVAILRRRDFV